MRKNSRNYTIDMINGSMWKKVILFALPLAATSILQQLFNSADVAVVGRFAGSDALAAVGANVANVGVFVNFLVGFSVGPNVVLAKLIGQGRSEESRKIVGSTVTLASIIGLFCLALGEIFAGIILSALSTPENVLGDAVLYFRIYVIGIPFMAVYNFAAALLRSVGDTRRPLYCLIISGVLNVALNLFFVIVCRMGVAGVALATSISNAVSCIMVIVILIREKGILHLELKNLKPDLRFIKAIVKTGFPAGVQNMVFSVSNMFIQAGINSFGSAAIAGSSAALNFEYFTYYMVAGFGQAAVTFTSQNYGAGKIARCKRVYWICMWEGMAFTAVMCLAFVIFRNQVVLLYTTDPEVIDYALQRMMCVMSIEFLTALYDVSCGALRGFGKALSPSILTILGTVVFRIIWMYTVFAHFSTFASLMIVYPVSWVLTAIMTTITLIIVYRKQSELIKNS